MAKNCIIDLPEATVERASNNANHLGTSLKEVIEDAITTTAGLELSGPWVTEKQLEEEDWCPSRVSLYEARKGGRLEPGKHYKKKGRFVFYDKAALKRMFSKEEESNELQTAELAK